MLVSLKKASTQRYKFGVFININNGL